MSQKKMSVVACGLDEYAEILYSAIFFSVMAEASDFKIDAAWICEILP